MLKPLGLRNLRLSSCEALSYAHSLKPFSTRALSLTASPFPLVRTQQSSLPCHFPSNPRRFYTGLASGTRTFAPPYVALLVIVSGMLGYGFARATIASDGKREHTKEVSYGSAGELTFAERELRAALSDSAVSSDKEELSLYGSSENS
jgi:hypothetical protein